jgi:hypothetical protein
MPKNIDNTEDGSGIYNTQIPNFEEAADIQAAFKLYHYGSTTVPTQDSEIVEQSIAGHIKAVDTRIDELEAVGLGADVSSSLPTGVPNGYIWVDQSSSAGSAPSYGEAVYANSEPSSPTAGTLWVDSDSSPLTLYVWSGTEWRAIGS